MVSPYINDILEQPAALQRTLAGLEEAPSLRAFADALSSGGYRQVVLTGMGSSYHAFQPLFLRLVALGLMVQLAETSELVHYMSALIHPQTLFIAASQSGASAETVQLLDMCAGQADVIGITNTAGSALAMRARTAVITQAGDEFSVSCKTYIATLAALSWVGDQLGAAPAFATLSSAPQKVASYLDHYLDHVAQLKTLFAPINKLYIAGRGASLAAVGTGALITKESARFPTEGMSSAAFRHGPLEIVSPAVQAIVLAGAPQTLTLNRQLVTDIQAAGGQVALVQSAPGTDAFHLPECPLEMLPILEILPLQMGSLALAELQGFEPGRFRHATKVTSIQ